MKFVHDSPRFEQLLAAVAEARDIDESLIEKDYWITHALWTLEHAGLDVWFKGGTSLSKGFGLIKRFSEDLDLKIGPGTSGIVDVTNWKSGGNAGSEVRKRFFDALSKLPLEGMTIELDESSMGKDARGANLRVRYPGVHLTKLPGAVSPFILLEVGDARVHPSSSRQITSFVHDHLEAEGVIGNHAANRPTKVNCVHPLVTLIEKLDAIIHRFPKNDVLASAFVRHYEDAAHIIQGMDSLPPMGDFDGVGSLIATMLREKQIRKIPDPTDACFNPAKGERWGQVLRAHESIDPLFWGPRLSLDDSSDAIRTFLGGLNLGLQVDPQEPDGHVDDEHFGVGFSEDFLKSVAQPTTAPSDKKRKGR